MVVIGGLRYSLSIVALLVALRVGAVSPSIEVTISDRSLEVGDAFQLFVKVEGEPFEDFVKPAMDGIRITQESSGKWLRGPRTMEYRCIAEKAGTIAIPPFTATVGGVQIVSEPIQIRVRESETGGRRKRTSPGSQEPTDKGAPQARQATVQDATFRRASVDKTEVYEGEGVQFELAWWRLNANVQIATETPPADPLFEGFYTGFQENDVKEETSNGFPYEVYIVRRLLYPTRSGQLTIPATEVQAAVFSMARFSHEKFPVVLKTDPITITVKPLPPRPKNFSGAVGEFTFEAMPTEAVHVQGVPFYLVARIAGTGNPDAVVGPELPVIEWAQVSEPLKSSPQFSGGMMEKKFTYTITPLRTGNQTIAPLTFCYFDTKREEYVTLTAGPFEMPVADSPETQQHMVHSADIGRNVDSVSVLSEGILPLDPLPEGLQPQRLSTVAFPVAAIIPPVGYVALALFLQRKRRFAADTAYSRSYRARQRAHEALAQAGVAAEPVEALSRATTGYLADVRNLAEGSITYADAQSIVAQLRIDPETAGRLLKVIRACERHRYAGAQLSGHEVLALVQAAEEAIDDVETLLRKGRTS